VIAVGPRPHVEDRGDGANIEFAIEMGEQFVIARALPAQGAAERIDIDGDQEQAGLAEIMLPRRLRDLGGGGEMNEAVAQVVRTAPVNALPFGLAPGRGRADFLDRGHGVADSLLVAVTRCYFWDFPGNAPGLAQTVMAAGRQLKRPRTGPDGSFSWRVQFIRPGFAQSRRIRQ
jgi:hypothetical protein